MEQLSWNNRHHVTDSLVNKGAHHFHREYFDKPVNMSQLKFVYPDRKSECHIIRKDDVRLLNRGNSVWNKNHLNLSTNCNKVVYHTKREYFDSRNRSISIPPKRGANSFLEKQLAPLKTHRLTAKQRNLQKREKGFDMKDDQTALLNEFKPRGNRTYFGSYSPIY